MKYEGTRKKLFLLTLTVLLLIVAAFPWRILIHLQQDLRILEGEERFINIASPWTVHIKGSKDGIIALNGTPVSTEANKVNLRSPLMLSAQGLGSVNIEFRLFGIIPLRQLTVNVLPEIKLLPGGHSVGIKLHSEGVLVVGHHLVNSTGQSASPAKEAGIETGDVILVIDGTRLDDANQVAEIINRQGKAGKTLSFVIRRAGNQLAKEVTPLLCRETGRYRIGLYIRDSAAGVGTMTFYDPNTGVYGALGHVITDVDTNTPIEVRDGRIVKANIVNIKTAKRGQPGEKTGIFQEDHDIVGTIEKNCIFGIFGRLDNINDAPGSYNRPMPIALMAQVETGPAEILTVVEGDRIEKFTIEIQRVYSQSTPGDKGMIIKVVDERLLEVAGGIVQGMSGSPIIQNNRLVGAVTHVFVNDPSRGYGIFIEWMIQESGLLQVLGDNI